MMAPARCSWRSRSSPAPPMSAGFASAGRPSSTTSLESQSLSKRDLVLVGLEVLPAQTPGVGKQGGDAGCRVPPPLPRPTGRLPQPWSRSGAAGHPDGRPASAASALQRRRELRRFHRGAGRGGRPRRPGMESCYWSAARAMPISGDLSSLLGSCRDHIAAAPRLHRGRQCFGDHPAMPPDPHRARLQHASRCRLRKKPAGPKRSRSPAFRGRRSRTWRATKASSKDAASGSASR